MILLVVSITAVINPEDKIPQSPVCPKTVDKLIARKNPSKIAIKFKNIKMVKL